MPIEKILLLVAMKKEAQPIIAQMQMTAVPHALDPHLPAEVYQVTTTAGEITLVVSGLSPQHNVDRIGSQGLNIVAWEAIKVFEPQLVINAGTGGGFNRHGAQPGDVYISTESIKYHDRLFFPDMYFLDYGIGSYPCLSAPLLAKVLDLKSGVISTGSSMLASEPEEKQMQVNNAAVKEMEAAGIAEIAQLRQVPFIAIKIITDLVDTDECPQNQFTNNFDKLIHHLADKVTKACAFILGKSLAQL